MSNPTSDGTRSPIPVVGIAPTNLDVIPPRLELRDMHKNYPDHWNLYLLGLERFKDPKITPENKPLSYYQISGIHGRPYRKWPDESWNEKMKPIRDFEDPDNIAKRYFGGFCTHSSIIFLPWHRPYLALFEAELYKHVNTIAEEYVDENDRARYISAAKSFRMPYWDWALPEDKSVGLFPREVLGSEEHEVTRPSGKERINPLASYAFDKMGRSDTRIDQFKSHATERYPTTSKPEDALLSRFTNLYEDKLQGDRNDGMTQEGRFYRKGKNLTERTLYLLQSYKTYKPISHNRFTPTKTEPWKSWGSLEDVHNILHDYLGGQGQMGDPKVSAFDPIFWLHHTNIDRLFAIWQALWYDAKKPETYVELKSEEASGTGQFDTDVKGPQNIKTKLTPFNRSDVVGDYWTSEQVTDPTTFGYTYPELQDKPTHDQLMDKLGKLYHGASLANMVTTSTKFFKQEVSDLKARAESHLEVAETSLDTTKIVKAAEKDSSNIVLPPEVVQEAATAAIQLPANRDVRDLVKDGKYLEWLIDIKAEKHSLGGDFTVHFFLGTPEDDRPELYVANPTHVGSFSTFGQDAETGCANCREGQAEHLQVTGQIPLTIALVERYLAGHVPGLTMTDVTTFLREHLHWRATKTNGERIGRADVDRLLVGVVTNEVTLPTDSSGRLQYAANVVPRPEVTTNSTGGSRGKRTGYTGGEIAVTA